MISEHSLSSVDDLSMIALKDQSPEWWRGYGFAGRLSEDSYVLWLRNASFSSANSDLFGLPGVEGFWGGRAKREFKDLRKSEFVLDNFFKLPNLLRQCVEVYAGDESSVLHIEAFVSLALMLPSLDDPVFSDGTATAWDVTYYFRQQVRLAKQDSSNNDFESALSEYLMHYNRDENLQLLESVVPMLALVYGIPLVTDVLQRWTRGSCPGTPVDFIGIVRNWDAAWSQYPIEWIANVAHVEAY